MADFSLNLGVQSWCFREVKDNRKLIEMLKDCNLKNVELCNVHADFKQPDQFEPVVSLYRQNGIRIFSIGVEGFGNCEAESRKVFESGRKAGLKVISANFDLDTFPECLTISEKLAEEYGINLAIHNHGGPHWLGSAAMLSHIFGMTGPRIGLCLDTAWALDSGENPLEMVDRFRTRLYSLHVKDFVFDRSGKPADVVVGEGNLPLTDLLQKLRDLKFERPVILEYEGNPENPLPEIKKCLQALSGA